MGDDLKLELYWSAPGGELVRCEFKDVAKTIDLELLIDFNKFEIDNILKIAFLVVADNWWKKASKHRPLKSKGIKCILKLNKI